MTEKRKKPLLSTSVTVAENRRARFDYFIEETVEAGIMLSGTEVKSLRLGQCSLNEAHAGRMADGLYLFAAHIPEYQQAGKHLQHTPLAPRRLLLHKRQMAHLLGAIQQKGYTLVPLKIYFNARGIAKVELGLGKGKKQYDKRATEKQRDWNREKQRLLKP